MIPDSIVVASYIVAIILGVGGAISTITYFVARYKNSKNKADSDIAADAMNNLKTTVEAVKTQNALQAGQITDAKNANAVLNEKVLLLTGKVETLSTVPLAKIEQHMADTNRILQAILPLIPSSSVEHTVTEKTVSTQS